MENPICKKGLYLIAEIDDNGEIKFVCPLGNETCDECNSQKQQT